MQGEVSFVILSYTSTRYGYHHNETSRKTTTRMWRVVKEPSITLVGDKEKSITGSTPPVTVTEHLPVAGHSYVVTPSPIAYESFVMFAGTAAGVQ